MIVVAVTAGLASHWPCVTDFSGSSTYGLTAKEREMSTPPTLSIGSGTPLPIYATISADVASNRYVSVREHMCFPMGVINALELDEHQPS